MRLAMCLLSSMSLPRYADSRQIDLLVVIAAGTLGESPKTRGISQPE